MRLISDFLRRKFEALLLYLAAWLLDRAVERSAVITRLDNNFLFEVVFELGQIASRVSSAYSKN